MFWIELDDSDRLVNHVAKSTMNKTEISSCSLLHELIKHLNHIVLTDADVYPTALPLASSYGQSTYVENNNNETHQTMRVINDPAKLETTHLIYFREDSQQYI